MICFLLLIPVWATPDLPSDFDASSKEMRSFYQSIRIKAHRVERLYLDREFQKFGDSEFQYEFCGDGKSLKTKSSKTKDAKGKSLSENFGCFVLRPDQTFVVRQNSSKKPAKIDLLEAKPNKETSDDLLSSMWLYSRAGFAPFIAHDRYVTEFVKDPDFKILKSETKDNVLKIEWQSNLVKEKVKRWGSFSFLAGKYPALTEYAYDFELDPSVIKPGGTARHGFGGSNSYEGESNGFPLIKTVKWYFWGADGVKYLDGEETVEVIKPGPVPSEEFTLDYLGFPTAPSKPFPLVTWIFVAAGALLVLGVGLRWIAQRRKV